MHTMASTGTFVEDSIISRRNKALMLLKIPLHDCPFEPDHTRPGKFSFVDGSGPPRTERCELCQVERCSSIHYNKVVAKERNRIGSDRPCRYGIVKPISEPHCSDSCRIWTCGSLEEQLGEMHRQDMRNPTYNATYTSIEMIHTKLLKKISERKKIFELSH